MTVFIGHDLGTGGNKAVLVSDQGELLAEGTAHYGLARPRAAFVEQDPEEWWQAVVSTTRGVLRDSGLSPDDVGGICFAGQMLALVPMDASGKPARPAISWMDSRADEQARRIIRRLGGQRALSRVVGALPTGKDLVAKIAWIAQYEPEVHRRVHAYGDATSYLVACATGEIALDPTAAGATGLFHPRRRRWSRLLAWLCSFPLRKMPPIRSCTEVIGMLTPKAAEELGLSARTPVAMGMADIPAAAIGSGAVDPGDAHLYLGTSSWIGVTTKVPKSVPHAGIASVPSAANDHCLVIGESETAGACRQWLTGVLGLARGPADPSSEGLDDLSFDELARQAPAGAAGLLFLPWMSGERSPIPDTAVRGGFVNLSLRHDRSHMARAIYEGVALNNRWILDALAGVGEPCTKLRVIGGGAQSDLWLQIIANVTGRTMERVVRPQHAGAVGAALVAAVAAGQQPSIQSIKRMVHLAGVFRPDPTAKAVYHRLYETFRKLHAPLSAAGRSLSYLEP